MKALIFILIIFSVSFTEARGVQNNTFNYLLVKTDTVKRPAVAEWIKLKKDIPIGKYFKFLDSLMARYDTILDYPLTEHLLVRANPRIIDTLANTDYYRMIAKDSFVYDQRDLVVLRKNDSIQIPSYMLAMMILEDFKNTLVDINLPEYQLRIYQDSLLLFSFPIRIGQNRKRYLAFGNRVTDLKTKTGSGFIVRHERNPDFYNPVTAKQFYLTKRDDNRVTVMPQIPWIETEINGIRNGQMIHPTTNPETLEKAYSNGCIGTREADAWYIYYYAPLGTAVNIRYVLEIKNESGEIEILEDVYAKK